ncbi:MAG: hypothetical protein S0880_06100 [Actinomycetota bacterium]|nr:hypothetical protein [Actinomycetota bacterium]
MSDDRLPGGLMSGARRGRRHFVDRRAAGDARDLRLIDLGALDIIESSQRWLDTNTSRLTTTIDPA